jgi:hypothetical protein
MLYSAPLHADQELGGRSAQKRLAAPADARWPLLLHTAWSWALAGTIAVVVGTLVAVNYHGVAARARLRGRSAEDLGDHPEIALVCEIRDPVSAEGAAEDEVDRPQRRDSRAERRHRTPRRELRTKPLPRLGKPIRSVFQNRGDRPAHRPELAEQRLEHSKPPKVRTCPSCCATLRR